jgi:Family of unknown function (DUF6345)
MAKTQRSLWIAPPVGGLLLGLLTATTMSGAPAGAVVDITAEAPYYVVTQEGMTPGEAEDFSARLGIPGGLLKNGAFSYADAKRYGKIPMKTGNVGKDEQGRRTVAKALNFDRLRAIEVLNDDKALGLAGDLLPLPQGFDARPRIDHTTVDLADLKGTTVESFRLDTSVSFDLTLGGVDVVGPGSRNRIAFAGDGSVLAVNQARRNVERAGFIGIIGADSALEQCVRLYGDGVKQGDPKLVYYSPPLSGQGDGSVKFLLPHYECQPVTADQLAGGGHGKLIPAAPELTPEVTIAGNRDGASMLGQVKITGGQEPYAIKWSSSSRPLTSKAAEVAYSVRNRGKAQPEQLSVTVTDANGIVASASVVLNPAGGAAEASGVGGEGGTFASVGIEQTVDEWQCAQDSAIGFKAVMAARAQTVKFDWRGTNAWETDFKRTSNSGDDSNWVDSVDAQWYTGHGGPNSFTFKNTTHSDGDITPNDARWGDNFNLEWMQLESCQVLADTNGMNDYFQRWAPAFDGLHILNGFHTNAQCVGGGTGRRFAEYLFPGPFWRPSPLTVAQAWQWMADDLEPGGTRWRSISPAKAGWVNNLGDYYWGQGSVGPDIPLSQQIGWVAISGTV